MRFLKFIGACFLSAILFFISWPPNGLTGAIFISFVPLIWMVVNFNKDRDIKVPWTLFLYLLFTFFLVNFSLTSWVMNAHWGGGLFAILLNTVLMSFVFVLVYYIHRYKGIKHAFISLPVFWLSFEYIHLNWELTWSWMNLGNIFSEKVYWIQWYEYTGILGGTLWVLLINILVYFSLNFFFEKKSISVPLFFLLLVLFLPLIYSSFIFIESKDYNGNLLKVVVVQPNFDPLTEKFEISQDQQINSVELLLDSIWSREPDLIVLPETFLTDWIWESRIENAPGIRRMRSWLSNHSDTQILTGASTSKVIYDMDHLDSSARRSKSGTWYKVFNTALLFSEKGPTQIYHKSKLVPGAEMTPFSAVFKPLLERFPIEIGGSIGNFGVNDSLINFKSTQGDFASLICYESIFGEYVGRFSQKNAQWICIITNDGWWGDTYGYQQHLSYARLRAVECRKSIVRSANTGISALILPNGMISHQLSYGESGILEGDIPKSELSTFYSIHGDYLGRLASFLAIIYLLQMIILALQRTKYIHK
jgi:apolipoprotein N-acyltransferase